MCKGGTGHGGNGGYQDRNTTDHRVPPVADPAATRRSGAGAMSIRKSSLVKRATLLVLAASTLGACMEANTDKTDEQTKAAAWHGKRNFAAFESINYDVVFQMYLPNLSEIGGFIITPSITPTNHIVSRIQGERSPLLDKFIETGQAPFCNKVLPRYRAVDVPLSRPVPHDSASLILIRNGGYISCDSGLPSCSVNFPYNSFNVALVVSREAVCEYPKHIDMASTIISKFLEAKDT